MNADDPPIAADEFKLGRAFAFAVDPAALPLLSESLPSLPYRRQSAGHRRSSAFPGLLALRHGR
jgi:hypothetical protein